MEVLTLTINGLYLSPNSFSEVPVGSLDQADDVVIDNPSICEPRRGMKKYGLLDGPPDKLYGYRGTLLAHFLDRMAYDSNGAGTFVNYSGSFDSPDGQAKPRSFEANQNFYLTSSQGIQKLQDVTSQFVPAGAPVGLGGTYSLTNPGWMSNNVQVAYRIVWGYRDLNNNEIVGAPSQRMIVINDTGATANVEQTWLIPDQVTTSWFYRVYRSAESAGVEFSPDDELGQIKEGNPTSGEISAGEVSFTDIVPNALRGATLYTSPSQEGSLQANYQPPFAVDICAFRGFAFYANTKSKQRYFGAIVAVGDNTLGGAFGYQTNNGDTHTNTTIDGLTKKASVVIQDLTYDADTAGIAGNSIAIQYTTGGTAGAEVVTVLDTQISVQIESGVSTATQVKTAVDASGAAAALVDITISGSGANPQVAQALTYLEDGFDTSALNVGMRVVGTGVQSGTLIVSIDTSSSITVTPATTATATVALEFQDRFSIDSMNYWAASTDDYPNRQFKATIDQTPGLNIETTTLNMIEAINRDPNNSLVYGYYTTNAGELPGQFLLEERGIGGSAFSITSTNGESFSPVLQDTGSSNISDNDERQNRIYISKLQQPEAVPVVNFVDAGSENYPIVRIIANRDSVFIFKEGEGIFRITGTDISTFIVSLFNASSRIKAAESAVVLNNQIFLESDQGIVAVDESGVAFVSTPPIQTVINEISSPQFASFTTASFGVSYETDRRYIFGTVSDPEDTYATEEFTFNTLTQAWTRWLIDASCGFVLDSDNKLYLGNPVNNYVYQERKNFDRTDYADEEFPVTIVSSDELEITLADTTGIGIGDVIKQNDLEAVVEEVSSSTVIVVSVTQVWLAGSATIYQIIPAAMKWSQNSAENPGILKHFVESTFIFKNAPFFEIDTGFQTDLNDSIEEVTLSAGSGQGWGLFPFGERPWGINGGKQESIRTLIPLECQRASWLNIQVKNKEAFSNFSLAGVTVQFMPMSSRQR